MAQDISPYYFIVENALRELGVEPGDCKGEMEGSWNLAYGELTLGIDLWEVPEQDDKIVFQVQAPVLKIAENAPAGFYKDVLGINFVLYAVAFAAVDGTLYLKTMRDAADMKHADVVSSIEHAGFYAEHYQKELLSKYGGAKL